MCFRILGKVEGRVEARSLCARISQLEDGLSHDQARGSCSVPYIYRS